MEFILWNHFSLPSCYITVIPRMIHYPLPNKNSSKRLAMGFSLCTTRRSKNINSPSEYLFPRQRKLLLELSFIGNGVQITCTILESMGIFALWLKLKLYLNCKFWLIIYILKTMLRDHQNLSFKTFKTGEPQYSFLHICV